MAYSYCYIAHRPLSFPCVLSKNNPPLLVSPMSKKNKGPVYEGSLKPMPKFQIYLNVNHLKIGKYTLKVIHKNKVIKKTTFDKK